MALLMALALNMALWALDGLGGLIWPLDPPGPQLEPP